MIDLILFSNYNNQNYHISTYSLIVEEHTKIYIDKVKAISEEIDLDMYNYIHKHIR